MLGRTQVGWRVLAGVSLVAGAIAASTPPSPAAPTSNQAAAARSGTSGSGVVPSDLIDDYLVDRPSLGPVTVVDISGESADRKLLAATLQGIVNRTEVRIYLRGMRSYQDDQHWLDVYSAHGLIDIDATVGLDAAVHQFRSEVGGYVIADAAEPWTVNTATSVAGAEGGVVATPATLALLQSEGITEIDDHRGRWPDAATAYDAIADEYRSSRAFPGIAIQQPDNPNARDLFVQQGTFVAYTRPSKSDYDAVYDVLETFPRDKPVYGYISDTGDEEVTAIVRLSQDGRYLVPTDTTDNLSFHQAVGAATRALPPPAPTRDDVEPCTSDQVNVVLAFSDGDNLTIAESYYPMASHWGSARRGELPLGWGLGPSAAVLMPAIWDEYASSATTADEIVDIMGKGYAIPSLMPNASSFLSESMRLRSALGVPIHWSLDGLLSVPTGPGWPAIQAAAEATGDGPSGYLLNYERWAGPPTFSAAGMTVLASQRESYETTPADLAALVQGLVDAGPDSRPLVSFVPATVWYASYDGLADAMAPLAAEGVRFLTPSEAIACLPPAAPATTSTTTTTTEPGATTSTTAAPGEPAAAPGAEAQPGTAGYVG